MFPSEKWVQFKAQPFSDALGGPHVLNKGTSNSGYQGDRWACPVREQLPEKHRCHVWLRNDPPTFPLKIMTVSQNNQWFWSRFIFSNQSTHEWMKTKQTKKIIYTSLKNAFCTFFFMYQNFIIKKCKYYSYWSTCIVLIYNELWIFFSKKTISQLVIKWSGQFSQQPQETRWCHGGPEPPFLEGNGTRRWDAANQPPSQHKGAPHTPSSPPKRREI